MSKIYLDTSKVSKECISNLNAVLSQVESMISILDNMYIPYDFNRKADLNKLKNRLSNLKSELKSNILWITNSTGDFSLLCNEFLNRAARIQDVKFGKRQ